MSQKINSNSLRTGFFSLPNAKNWKSLWFADNKREYSKNLRQDLAIKEAAYEQLKAAGVDEVIVKRPAGRMSVEIYVGRPGVAIGRGGEGVESLTKEIRRIAKDKNVDVKIKEVRKADLSARILASEIASGLERRMPPKLLAQSALQKAVSAGAKGVKIWVGGRINGAQQARTIKFSHGAVPLHTLKADIDFALVEAETLEYGKFGIKVWILNPNQKENK